MRCVSLFLLSVVLLCSCGHDAGKYRATVRIHEKYGYIDETGEFVVDPQFDVAWVFIHGSAVVKKDGKYGLIDKMGDWIIEPTYDSVRPFSINCFIIIQDSAFGFMEHGTGKILVAPQYEQVYNYTDDLCVVQKGRALGIVNSNGVVTCTPQLQDLKEMFGPLATVVQSDTSDEMSMLISIIDGGAVKAGLINRKGEFVVPCKYNDIFDDATNGFYYPFIRDERFTNDSVIGEIPVLVGKYGIVDTAGNILSEPLFDELPVYGDEMFRVSMNGKYGYADKQGKVVIPPKWDFAVSFSEGKAIVSDAGNSSIIDKTGKVLADNLGAGTGMYRFIDGRVRCRSNDGLYGFMDANGKRIIPPIFEEADDFTEGVAVVTNKEGQSGLIDTMGNFVVQPQYEFLFYLGDGLFKAKDRGGKTGVINSAGKEIVAVEYEDAFHLQKNYIMVEQNQLSGCFDVTGKMVYPVNSSLQLFFVNGVSIVYSETKCGLIDTSGKFIIPAEYDSIGYFDRGYTIMSKNGVYGAVDSTGKIVIEAKYTTLQSFVNGLAVFRYKGKYGYVNAKGEEVIAADFDEAGVMVDPENQVF
jgi:hypothetical protein